MSAINSIAVVDIIVEGRGGRDGPGSRTGDNRWRMIFSAWKMRRSQIAKNAAAISLERIAKAKRVWLYGRTDTFDHARSRCRISE